MDLSSRDSILAIIAKAQEYGEIKYLVNAAGEIRMVSFMNKAGKNTVFFFTFASAFLSKKGPHLKPSKFPR